MKEEDVIKKKVGTELPFKVPENYFEQFTQKVMEQLPPRPKRALLIPTRTIILKRIAVACSISVIGGFALFGIRYLSKNNWIEQGQQVAVEAHESSENSYIDDLLDYTMIDNQEIYAYLSEIE